MGCSMRPNAQGKENRLFIFASPEDKLQVQPFVESIFKKEINTPQFEKEIEYIWKYPWELETYKHRPNLMILSLTHPEDSTGDLLYKKIASKNFTNEKIYILDNLFANKQQVLCINTIDAIDFQLNVYEHKKWILDTFNSKIDENLWQYIKEKGVNEEIQHLLKEQYGINSFIQEDYKILNSSDDFIWIGRGYPYRWLTFHRNIVLNERSWHELIPTMEASLSGIKISNLYQQDEIVTINNEKVNVFRGVYIHEESDTGGPFVIYIIDGNKEKEVNLLSGFVNNPGHEKLPLLRQLEVIIKHTKFEGK